MSNIAIDVDGTIDAFPFLFQHLIAGWTASADHVFILTGIGSDTVTDDDHAAKVGYLTSLGISPESYYQLVVVPTSEDAYHATNKANFIRDNKIDLLIDNNVDNCKAAKQYCAVFCLWNVKMKSDKGKDTPLNLPSEPRASKTCSTCETVVDKSIETCPNCGADLSLDQNEGLSEPNNDRLPIL